MSFTNYACRALAPAFLICSTGNSIFIIFPIILFGEQNKTLELNQQQPLHECLCLMVARMILFE